MVICLSNYLHTYVSTIKTSYINKKEIAKLKKEISSLEQCLTDYINKDTSCNDKGNTLKELFDFINATLESDMPADNSHKETISVVEQEAKPDDVSNHEALVRVLCLLDSDKKKNN